MSKKFVRRIAAAIAKDQGVDLDQLERSFHVGHPTVQMYERFARVAIEAMKDPTQGMRITGHAALSESKFTKSDVGSDVGYAAIGNAWRAMINDALSDT